MGDDTHARGTKGATGKLGVGGGGRRREVRAADVAEAGAGTLKGGAPFQHCGQAFAAAGTRPGVAQEFRSAIELLEALEQPLLQIFEVGDDIVHGATS